MKKYKCRVFFISSEDRKEKSVEIKRVPKMAITVVSIRLFGIDIIPPPWQVQIE